MAFTQTITVRNYQPRPAPASPGSEKQYLAWELRELSQTIASLTQAVEEIQAYLKTLP